MGSPRRKEPNRLTAAIVAVALLVVVPLPAALYFGGTEWLVSGWQSVPAEFIASYVVGFVAFWGGIAVSLIRKRWRRDNSTGA